MKRRATRSLALSLLLLASALPVRAGDNKKTDVNEVGKDFGGGDQQGRVTFAAFAKGGGRSRSPNAT